LPAELVLRKPRPTRREALPKTLRAIGRPSLYLQEYCQQIVDYCAKGYSPGAWAGSKRIPRSTLDTWARSHPEFQAALKAAQAARQERWETKLIEQSEDPKATGPQVTATIFALKGMHAPDWKEQPPEVQPQEQHRHVHIHAGMNAVAASEAYQRLLKEL
jgi:hypothetical protein